MWNACVKGTMRHALPPRCCVKPSALKTAGAGGNSRRTRTAASEPRGRPVEPDIKVLETLVCPFSKDPKIRTHPSIRTLSLSRTPNKSPLTYDRDARELVSPVGVAYPITASGIPNMVPACARIMPSNQEEGQEG